jgi:hypothetical protein
MRDKVGTLALQSVELVDDQAFEGIVDRLPRPVNDNALPKHGLTIGCRTFT